MTGGTLILIIHRTLYNFGYLPANTTGQVVIAKAVNVIPYSTADLWVRVYQLQLGAGASARIEADGALPADDTQASFLQNNATQVSLTGSPPLLLTNSISAPLPPYLQISVVAAQPVGAPVDIGFEISVDLLVRCCG